MYMINIITFAFTPHMLKDKVNINTNSSQWDKPQHLLNGKVTAESFHFRQSTKSTCEPLFLYALHKISGSIH